MNLRLAFAVLASVLALGAAATALLRSPKPAAPSRQDAFSHSFAILRTPSETPQTLAGNGSLKSAQLAAPSVQFDNAQRAGTAHGGLWILASERMLCIAQPRGAACSGEGSARQSGVVLGTFLPPTHGRPTPHSFLLQGLVPDDVNRVLVLIGEHQRLLVHVRRNVFSVERDQPVRLLKVLRN